MCVCVCEGVFIFNICTTQTHLRFFQLDGREYFDMPQSRGKVTVKRTLDYDKMDPHYYMLNISVAVSQIYKFNLIDYTN